MSFPELLDAALAGAQNHAPPTLPGDAESATPEQRLLRAASFAGLRWLAGRPIERADGLVPGEAAPPEPLEQVPPTAAARLLDILEQRTDVLGEWLELTAARRMRVPPLYLPDLLECVRQQDSAERQLALQVGGARMAWLASMNPDWRFAAYSDPEDQLATGAREDRPAALRRIRRRDPARGRELLMERWPSERADGRAHLLAALETGLSPADEDLLQRALGDARHDVRLVALRLIRRVPGSRFGQRWTDRARQIVNLSANRLVVHEPTQVDPAWVADGLDGRPPKDTGLTAWLLQQILALTPSSHWAAEVLEAIGRTDWARPLLAGLSQAAAAYADDEWCARLIRWHATAPHPEPDVVDVRGLLLAVPHQHAERLLQELLDLSPVHALSLTPHLAGRWSEQFSRTLLERLPRLLDGQQSAVAAVLRQAPVRLDPRVLPDAERWLDAQLEPLWIRPSLERVVTTLDYRLALRRELGY